MPSDAQLWWTLLEKRIADLRAALPRALSGLIQLEIEDGEHRRYFAVALAGPSTRTFEGLATQASAWVSTRAEDLSMMVADALPGQSPSLEVIGDLELVRGLFRALDKPAPASALGLRSRR